LVAGTLGPIRDAHAGNPRDDQFQALSAEYVDTALPMLKQFCFECHSTDKQIGELDLEQFANLDAVRRGTDAWLKVREMLENQEMPPKKAKQLAADQRKKLHNWVERYLHAEALANAGDPGPVVLRRLSNAEYTYTIRDLTGVPSLYPAREFPVDGAAGEGFTNTGSALVMSPSLVTKYLGAAKEIAAHAVLLPDGFRFSKDATSSDWTNQMLANIREFYSQFTDSAGGEKVDLQGVVFDTNQGGRLPVEKYLLATLRERKALANKEKSIETVAIEQGLNAKYLRGLWQELSVEQADLRENADPGASLNAVPSKPSYLMDGLRARWRMAKPEHAALLANEITQWQQALWRFSSVGHIGKVGGPKSWIEPVNPLTDRQEIKLKLPDSQAQKEIVLYLTAGDAGDGHAHDFVVWERPRLVAAGRPDLLLRDVRAVTQALSVRRERIFASTAKCLAAAADASTASGPVDIPLLAKRHGVDAESLVAWFDYLGIASGGQVQLGTPISRTMEGIANYDFIKGWVGDDALSVLANSSDQHVRIPGNMKPHSIAVHPTPTLSVAVGWRSLAPATLNISGNVQHAHPECGNGVAWSLELRRGNTRQRLATGNSQGTTVAPIGPLEQIAVQARDVLSLVINPRDGNHSCDLTAIDLKLNDGTREWDLARELSPNILAGNPHNDAFGNEGVWHFYSEPVTGSTGRVIPSGTLLARWQAAANTDEKAALADAVQKLLMAGPAALAKDAVDTQLYEQLTSLSGPLFANVGRASQANTTRAPNETTANHTVGLDPSAFGKHPNGESIESASLCVQAPSVIEVRLPADLVAGAEFVATGTLHPVTGEEGSVQLQVLTKQPEATTGLRPTESFETMAKGPWTSNNRGVSHATPIIAMTGSTSRKQLEHSFDEYRRWFPAALCYTKIVPVDEVVTLTLFYREDDHLQRLMLDDAQKSQLDRLWNELHFISHDALTLVDAFQQLMEYATQDADPSVFEPMRKPINDRASAFRKELLAAETKHLDALIRFAARAYRRHITEAEAAELRELYRKLRQQQLSHEDAFRLTLARVLTAPTFLYRLEQAPPGTTAAPVSDAELANRLSYFLWSSLPDDELRAAASSGQLHEPEALTAQANRMMTDPRIRRLATEFVCQWLHIYDFDSLDEKSEKHFPEFNGLRGDMYEESILVFTDLFQNNGSVLDLLNADYTFLNEDLAKHYGIPGVTGSQWRRVNGVQEYSRGGILSLATTLSKQSGASRTSPILRGNWLNEVVLGEKLPRPPKNVPQLPESVPDGLTERQLIERHSNDESCIKCHARMDPFGFALENFDAIGRFRVQDAGGLNIETRTTLPDGTQIDGLVSLRDYLANTRRDAFLRQFCRKLLGYALGRGIQLSDEPLLEQMRQRLTENDYRVSIAVQAILESNQFRYIRGREYQREETQ
jgi:hypothetical protein